MDLCFKVEAIDATGRAIELYEPICVPKFVPSQAQKDDKTQWASNAQGTLYGENMEDSIVLDWELDDRAAQYFVYRATSLNGPWNQVLGPRKVLPQQVEPGWTLHPMLD